MNIRWVVLGLLCCIAGESRAGDAIAVGYNYGGVWTAVTYNRSSTPRGGSHYRESAQACVFAMRDLRVRANEDLVRTEIVGQSDRTGYVAVARGRAADANKDVTAVGRGASQPEADEKAFALLKANGGTGEPQIVYRYFSYGSDSGVHRSTRSDRERHKKSAATKRNCSKLSNLV